MEKQILIIGAGSVGLVYGQRFAEAGHSVTFFVREKYLDILSNGTFLYNMNRDRSLKQPINFTQYSLISTFQEIGDQQWDQIYLCFSSTALQAFDFAGFKDHLTGKPTIVMLQPSMEDYDVLVKTFPPEQIVEGMITLISYSTPLSTETVEVDGTAYWIPPMMPTPFSGFIDRRKSVIKTFREGKMSASYTKSVQEKSLFPASFLATFLTALESSNWKFKSLRKNQALLQLLKRAVNEIYSGLELKHKVKRPFAFRLINSTSVYKILLILAPRVMPMDIETYFEAHFTKVNDQTKLYMRNYLLTTQAAGLPHDNVEQLIQSA